MTAIAGLPPRGGLTLATPGGWFEVKVPTGPAQADALSREIVTAYRGATYSPPKIRGLIDDLAHAWRALSVASAYVALYETPNGSLPVTMTICVRSTDGSSLDEIATEMATGDDTRYLRQPISLPTGEAIRLARLRQWPGIRDGSRTISLVVQYVVAAPEAAIVAILTFSTPALGLADQLLPVFDAIARTVRFAQLDRESECDC